MARVLCHECLEYYDDKNKNKHKNSAAHRRKARKIVETERRYNEKHCIM